MKSALEESLSISKEFLPKIAIRDLTIAYSDRRGGKPLVAVRGINLGVQEGEFICLLGPSGCGKTTLLNSIAGFITPACGEILMDGKRVEGPGSDRGMIFQEYGLFPWFTVEQNIQYGPKLRRMPKEKIKAISDHYIRLVNLVGFEHHYPLELSGGMKQRVGIARALANQPEVLLLDEPFGALDAQTRETMQTELLKIWQEEKKTCIFVTHSIAEAVFLSDRVAVMSCRPARIKSLLNIKIPRMRSRTSTEFFEAYREIDAILREEISKGVPDGKGSV